MNIELYNNSLNNIKIELTLLNNIIIELNNICNNIFYSKINNNSSNNISDINSYNLSLNSDINLNNISNIDYLNLYETIFILFDDITITDIIYIYNPNYINEFIDEVYHILEITLIDELNIHELEYIYETVIDIGNIYFTNLILPRSYDNTFIKNKYDKDLLSKQITYLKNIPQPEQRTKEWYEFRHNILTASNIWKAFDTDSAYDFLVYEKCKPLDTNKYSNFSTSSPMHWGQKYEPVSIFWYEHMYKTQISDFGCIQHNSIKFLAASPDGINTLKNSDRYGRMLEIKNIVNRKIDGIPKKEYWIQMQIQMETCDLDECDFLETKFVEYESEEDFYLDGTFTESNDKNIKGIIMYFIKDEYPYYQYAPFMCSEDEFKIWEAEIMEKYSDLTWMKNIYWKLVDISCVLVERNKLWFSSIKETINKLWKTIEYERINGYEHRAPKKRKINKQQIISDNSFNKCLININMIDS